MKPRRPALRPKRPMLPADRLKPAPADVKAFLRASSSGLAMQSGIAANYLQRIAREQKEK